MTTQTCQHSLTLRSTSPNVAVDVSIVLFPCRSVNYHAHSFITYSISGRCWTLLPRSTCPTVAVKVLLLKMVRKLKFHEQKLLKKVDFVSWKTDTNIREVQILRKYHIQKRDDYTKWVESILHLMLCSIIISWFASILWKHRYNKLAGMVKSLATRLKELDPRDPFRNETTTQLLEKL